MLGGLTHLQGLQSVFSNPSLAEWLCFRRKLTLYNILYTGYNFSVMPNRGTFKNAVSIFKTPLSEHQIPPCNLCDCCNCWFLVDKKSAFSRVTSWVMSWSELSRTLKMERFMVIGAFHCAHVDKSIPWTVIGCWPRNGHIGVYIYTGLFFSGVTGSVLSYSLFYFCLSTGCLLGLLGS